MAGPAATLLLLSVALLGALPARAEDSNAVPLSTFAAQVTSARQIIAACGQRADDCNATGLPGREKIQGGPAGDFTASWDWLRTAVTDAKTAKLADRVKRMTESQAHLAALAAQAQAAPPLPAPEYAAARRAANTALARDEFRASEGPTWLQRQIAKVQDWFLRLFTGMDRLGRRAPWLAPSIEWGCFGVAAAGLLWFVRQSLARQALRISLSEGAALAGRGDRDSADWAKLAQERAAAGDWREAIHCLYWAAIALMETRRAWKPNATRTPREYLRLLRPGSEAQTALRELTRVFERSWYGHAAADGAQYEAARSSFSVLEAARPERLATGPEGAVVGPVAAAGGV
jgi:hypothetical protein